MWKALAIALGFVGATAYAQQTETFDTYVQGLPSAVVPLNGNEAVPIIQNGSAVQVSSSNIAAGSGVTNAQGTTGQVVVSPNIGNVIVSLPSTITANLVFAGNLNFTGTDTFTTLTAGTGIFTTATITTGTATNWNTTNATSVNFNATNIVTTNLTATNFSITNLVLPVGGVLSGSLPNPQFAANLTPTFLNLTLTGLAAAGSPCVVSNPTGLLGLGTCTPVDAISPPAKCDGSTNDTATIQAGIASAISAGLKLFIPPSINGCIVNQSGTNSYALLVTSPLYIEGIPGFSIIQPAPTMPTTVDVLHLTGNANTYQRMVIDGVMIANPSAGTSPGRHRVVFDTLLPNELFLRPIIQNNYMQTPASSQGFSFFVTNSATGNANGGFAYGDFENNYIGSGVSLNSAGDSIDFHHNVFSGTSTNDSIYVNLIAGAGNLDVSGGNNFGVNATSIHVDCASTVHISNNEIEHNNTGVTTASINLSGNICAINGGAILNNETQVLTGTGGTPGIINVGNAVGIGIDYNRFALPTAYVPITLGASAQSPIIGAGNQFVGVSAPLTDNTGGNSTVYAQQTHLIGHTIHADTCSPGTTCFFSTTDILANESFTYLRFPAPAAGGRVRQASFWSGNGAPGTGQGYTLTMRHNNADTTITCVITGAASNSCGDGTHQVTMTAADTFTFKVIPSAGAVTLQDIQWTLELIPGFN